MRVHALFLVLLIPSIAGCGAAQKPGAAGTELTIRAVNSNVGRSEFHLSCEPPGGDLPNPARACAALAEEPDLVTHPERFICAGGTDSWWDVTVSGSLEGKPIHTEFSTCWTGQMATIERLGMGWKVLQAHLLPRRHEEVFPETRHVFEPGELEVADLITCDIRGHHLEAGAPSYTGGALTVGYNGANIVGVTMTVERHDDGSVVADCHTDT